MRAILLMVVLCSASAFAELPYAFHAELEEVHARGLRDAALRPSADELELRDGLVLAVPAGADALVERAAADFADYLRVSMGVSARVAVGTDSAPAPQRLAVRLDATLAARQYRVAVTAREIAVTARDARAAAQALYHLEDLMNLREAPFLAIGAETRTSKFSPRMVHSGWGIDTFPEPYLRKMAHHGFDAILVFIPSAGRTQRGYDDVNAIVDRAAKWGIDTYVYSYMKARVHPDDPKAPEVFRSACGSVAAAYPNVKGYIVVSEGCHFPSKDPRTNGCAAPDRPAPGDTRPWPANFPCRDFPAWFAGVKGAINAVNPKAEVVFWTYSFAKATDEEVNEFIRALPMDVPLLLTFEMFENSVKRNGMRSRVWDYSLSDPGPSRRYLSQARECGRLGHKFYTMSNTAGLTWDLGTVPYLPCPYQWKKRWDKLGDSKRDLGLAGLMESHHYGWYPSFVTELSKEAFTEGGLEFGAHLRAIAVRDFGAANADAALAAWKGLTEAIEDSFPCPQNLAGPYRIGPAFPFNFGGRRIGYDEVPWPPASPYLRQKCWTYFNYLEDFAASREPPVVKTDWEPDQMKLEIELLAGMVRKANAAADAFAAMVPTLPPRKAAKARKAADLARYMACAWTTVSHLRAGALATFAKDEAKIRELARAEYANKKAALDLVRRDSRLGWEPSMDYMGGEKTILWSMNMMEKLYELK